MIYTCPIHGELENEDVVATCQICGAPNVTEEGDVFICPNCGQVSEDEVVLSCKICRSKGEKGIAEELE
jgi:predicted RNA-binding Zn-ribbon protein involved in translation (DUF1610 family)